ncbi:MAG: choice-of-anchor L domain-containing protein, partial [Alphaproteobacteria bacterium]|nr:choice-of-anchor L domain-containing protein [Alphaproteobacteria bacterium]
MLNNPRWSEKTFRRGVDSTFREKALNSGSREVYSIPKEDDLGKVAQSSAAISDFFRGMIRALGLSRFFKRRLVVMRRRVRRARKAIAQNAVRRLERARQRKKQLLDAAGSSGLHALEPRMVFDAAGVASADATSDQMHEQDAAAAETEAAASESGVDQSASGDLGDAAAQIAAVPGRTEIAFVDGNVADIELLIAGIDPSVEIVVLDPNADGVEQIAAVLQGRSDIDAIHILSHGDQGKLFLGNDVLDAASMQGEHLDELTAIRDALSADGDILIYGCDFTGGEAGLEAAILLGSITGADIAASVDATGHADLGGDWDLETEVGAIEADSFASEGWHATLAPLAVNDMSTGITALDLAEEIVGDGVTILSASFSGVQQQAAIFSGALDPSTGAPGAVGFDRGVILTSGYASDFFGNNTSDSTSRDLASGSDPALDALNPGGQATQDAAILEISFIPTQSEITMQYVFGSEEYSEFVYGGFNDTWAIFVNGVNIALAPNNLPLGIDTVNDAAQYNPTFGSDANDPNPGHNTGDGIFESAHESLYVNNPSVTSGTSTYNVAADGFTITMSVIANVNANEVNTIRIALADTADGLYDSWLLLRGDSLQTSPIARPDVVVPDPILGATVDVLANDSDPVAIAPGDQPLSISHINGSSATVGVPVVLPSGATVTLNADQTLHVTAPTNGATGDAFTYTITDGANESVGVVTIANTVNDAPVLTVPGAQTVDSNSPTGISGFDLFDIDAGYSNVTATATVANGTISVTEFAGLTVSGNGTGTLTFTGPVIQIKNALNSLEYTPYSGFTGADTLNVVVDDLGNTGSGGALNDTGSIAITVADLSHIPTVNLDPSNNSGGSDDGNYEVNFSTAVGTPVNIADGGIDIADSDSTAMSSASISLFSAPDGNNERLIFNGVSFQLATSQTQTVTVSGTTFSIAYAAGSRTFTITQSGGGTMPVAALEALFAATTYNNVAGTPTTSDRFVSFSVNDGANSSNISVTTIKVAMNAPPTLDLDSTDSGTPVTLDVASNTFETGGLSGGTGWSTAWTTSFTGSGGSGDVQIASDGGDNSLSLKDDGVRVQRTLDLSGATAAILSFDYRRDSFDNATDYVAIEVSTSSAGGFVEIGRFTGSATDANYLTFSQDITAYISATTTIRFVTSSSLGNSDVFFLDNVAVSATVPGPEPTSFATTYDVKVGAVAIASADTAITDADSANMLSATIVIANHQAGDLLTVAGSLPTGITASSYSAATGTLTLSGSASIADYQAAIEAIQFSSSSLVATDRTIHVSVSDGGFASNVATSTISIVPNSAPVADNETASTNEDMTLNVAAGSGLLVGDVDPDGDAISVSQFTVAGSATVFSAGDTASLVGIGDLTILANGSYTFVPSSNYNGSVPVVTYTVSDGYGGTDTGTLTLTVDPVNDVAVIGGDDAGSVTEDASSPNLTDSGVLTISDVDAGEAVFTAETVTGTYGDLTIDASGNWSYAAANGQAAIQQLGLGDTLSDTFTVTSADGTTHTVTITINGINDAAAIGGDDIGSVTEDASSPNLTDTGVLTITDADSGEAVFNAETVTGTYGDLTIDASGNWSYAAANGQAAIQQLGLGDTLS